MKAICTTTIHPPSEALRKFSAMDGWRLIVAGDKKTPHGAYACSDWCRYLSPDEQERMDKPLSDTIGWNCIQRRNFAFLHALELGADIIATVDDDNVPLENWGKVVMPDGIGCLMPENRSAVFDPLSLTAHCSIWHRGFPLEMVRQRCFMEEVCNVGHIDIQADLWNGDPDVDAVCRMLHRPNFTFGHDHFIASPDPSPFNSQNTFLRREVMPHYFMFPHVGRWDDICAAYHVHAQHKFQVVYGPASVVQERNAHDVMADFANEVWGYQHTMKFVEGIAAGDREAVLRHLPTASRKAFDLYQKRVASYE